MRGEEEIHHFSKAMLCKLNEPRNVNKGTWKGCSPLYLLWRHFQEYLELCAAVVRWYWNPSARNAQAVKMEAADNGIFAMMVADVCTLKAMRSFRGRLYPKEEA